jgi:hypothetical protein
MTLIWFVKGGKGHSLHYAYKDMCGPHFPGATFHVFKEEEREYGEYRTTRLVLGVWDRVETW